MSCLSDGRIYACSLSEQRNEWRIRCPHQFGNSSVYRTIFYGKWCTVTANKGQWNFICKEKACKGGVSDAGVDIGRDDNKGIYKWLAINL